MNSFATREETLSISSAIRSWGQVGRWTLSKTGCQSWRPAPLSRSPGPSTRNWSGVPRGHGDLYPSLYGNGLLEDLLSRDIRYMFVSNSDNLGATVDLRLLDYFAREEMPFLMEVALRTAADRKGGHLARHAINGRLLLRESAQCPKSDEAAFQDIARHRFFNTNNLWIRLDHLHTALEQREGTLPLPLITNTKTVDPKDPASPPVLQLESAMGAAIECFDRAGAILVPRTRFAPVKTTADLLALRSDAYIVTEDWRLVLAPDRAGQPPVLELDSRWYKLLSDFDQLFPEGVPSLARCERLKVDGPVCFSKGVVCEGKVEFVNASSSAKTVAPGKYAETRVQV